MAADKKNLILSGETCDSHNSPYAARFCFVRHLITQFEIIPGITIISFLYLSQSLQFEENNFAEVWYEVNIYFACLAPQKPYPLKYLLDLQSSV